MTRRALDSPTVLHNPVKFTNLELREKLKESFCFLIPLPMAAIIECRPDCSTNSLAIPSGSSCELTTCRKGVVIG